MLSLVCDVLNPYNAEIFLHKPWKLKGFYQAEISQSALSASFEYLCYGSMAIIHILILSLRGSSS